MAAKSVYVSSQGTFLYFPPTKSGRYRYLNKQVILGSGGLWFRQDLVWDCLNSAQGATIVDISRLAQTAPKTRALLWGSSLYSVNSRFPVPEALRDAARGDVYDVDIVSNIVNLEVEPPVRVVPLPDMGKLRWAYSMKTYETQGRAISTDGALLGSVYIPLDIASKYQSGWWLYPENFGLRVGLLPPEAVSEDALLTAGPKPNFSSGSVREYAFIFESERFWVLVDPVTKRTLRIPGIQIPGMNTPTPGTGVRFVMSKSTPPVPQTYLGTTDTTYKEFIPKPKIQTGVISVGTLFLPVWDESGKEINEHTLVDTRKSLHPRPLRGSLVKVSVLEGSYKFIETLPWKRIPKNAVKDYVEYLGHVGDLVFALNAVNELADEEEVTVSNEDFLVRAQGLVAPLENVRIGEAVRRNIEYSWSRKLSDLIWKGKCWVIRLLVGGVYIGTDVYVDDDLNFIASGWCQRQSYREKESGVVRLQDGRKYTLYDWIVGPCTIRLSSFGAATPKTASIGYSGGDGGAKAIRVGGAKHKVVRDWEFTLDSIREAMTASGIDITEDTMEAD